MSRKGRPVPEIEAELDERVEALDFEVVQVEWAGSDRRPILRLRIDVGEEVRDSAEAEGAEGVTLDDCARVSRALEAWLDTHDALPEKYVLEVSSPGVERPLTRTGDWSRFVGEEIAVKGPEVLVGRATRLEGELLGQEWDEDGAEIIHLRLPNGDEVGVPRDEIDGAHVIFRWT